MTNPLRNLLHLSFMFNDGLKDAGLRGEARVSLCRADGLTLLKMVTQCDSPMVEAYASDRFTIEEGQHCLKVAGLEFCWPAGQTIEAEGVRPRLATVVNIASRIHRPD